MKYYISGPISKLEKAGKDWKTVFYALEWFVKNKAPDNSVNEVFNPAEIGRHLEEEFQLLSLGQPKQSDYMTECSKTLYENFYNEEGVMMLLPGWDDSTRCKIEHAIGTVLQMEMQEMDGEKLNIVIELYKRELAKNENQEG